jgi:fatty acid desaturase
MQIDLCKYKNLFGQPNAGIRKYRIFDIAIYDTSIVIIIGILFSYFTGYNIWITLAVLFISGIIVHRMFCVRTGLDKLLFPS